MTDTANFRWNKTDSRKFPTKEIMGAQNFNFAPTFPENWGFQPHIFLFLNIIFQQEQNFLTAQNSHPSPLYMTTVILT